MNMYTKIGIAFAAGAVAGAITGLLLAPEKGSETRENLKKRAKAFEADFKEMKNQFMKTAGEAKEKLMKEAETVLS